MKTMLRRNKWDKSIAWALIFAALVAGAIYFKKPHRMFDIVVFNNNISSLAGLGENELLSTPDRFKANQGDLVTIKIITEEDNSLYIHGYEERLITRAGKQARLSFVADKPGEFKIELETTGADLGLLEVLN